MWENESGKCENVWSVEHIENDENSLYVAHDSNNTKQYCA